MAGNPVRNVGISILMIRYFVASAEPKYQKTMPDNFKKRKSFQAIYGYVLSKLFLINVNNRQIL